VWQEDGSEQFQKSLPTVECDKQGGSHILISPGSLESRMPSVRCMSGSTRGRATPLISRPERRAHLTQPYIPMTRGFLYLFAMMDWQAPGTVMAATQYRYRDKGA
jgi:hypothetical protein